MNGITQQEADKFFEIAQRQIALNKIQAARIAEMTTNLQNLALVIENNKAKIGYHEGSEVDRWVKQARAVLNPEWTLEQILRREG